MFSAITGSNEISGLEIFDYEFRVSNTNQLKVVMHIFNFLLLRLLDLKS